MKHWLYILVLFLLLSVAGVHPIGQYATQVSNTIQSAQLTEINKIRSDNDLKPLEQTHSLNESAIIKANDLADNNYWSHDRPNGEPFSRVIFDHNQTAEAVGENLAKCYDDKSAVVAWTESPSHYQNIIDDWTYWGYGSAQSGSCTIIVNHFSK